MADELDPVEQQFLADMAGYLDELERGIDEARSFARANAEAKAAIDGMRDSAAEAGIAVDEVRDADAEAAETGDRLRDSAIEAGEALGHVRDEALEAAVAMHEMRDASREHLGSIRGDLDGLGLAARAAAEAFSGGGGGGEAGLVEEVGSASMSMGPLIVAAGALAAVLLGPLIAGLFAVTASIGSLALFAVPAFSKIWGAATGGKKAMSELHGPMHQVAEELHGLIGEFGQISKAVMPSVIQMFGDGLKVVQALMPSLKPLAEGAAKAFGGFFNKIADWLNGPSGQKFLHWLDTEGPKAMMDFAGFLWDLANIVGRVFDFLNNAGHAWYLHFSQGLHSIRVDFDNTRHAVADFAHNVAAHFDEMRHDIATWAHDVANDFDTVRHDVADFAHNVAAHFDELRHDIATWGHDVAHTFDDVRHTIATWGHDLASYFDEARANIHRWADDVGRDAMDVVHWFEELPGRIVNALASLAGDLFRVGINLMEGLIHGIESMVGSAISAGIHAGESLISGIGHALGIGSPSRITFQHGVWLVQGLIDGMSSMAGPLAAAAAHVSGMVGLQGSTGGGRLALAGGGYGGGGPVPGAGGGGTVLNVTVHVAGSVVTERELINAVQEGLLQRSLINQSVGLWPANRGPLR